MSEELKAMRELGQWSTEIESLTAQLAEAQARVKELETTRGNSVLVPTDKLTAMQQQISDLQSRIDARGEAYRIDYDEEMDRYYIPVHANWEIQTKGKGSSFRIANRKTGDRWLVGDSYLHEMLEQMARDIATYTQPTYLKGVAAGLRKAAEVCEANKNVVAKSNPARIEIKCCTENNMVDRCICSILAIKPEEV